MADKSIRYSEVPETPLAYLATKMTEHVPEGTRVVIMLTNEETRACMTHTSGYNDSGDPKWNLLTDVVSHMDAVLGTYGISPLAFMSALAVVRERREQRDGA